MFAALNRLCGAPHKRLVVISVGTIMYLHQPNWASRVRNIFLWMWNSAITARLWSNSTP